MLMRIHFLLQTAIIPIFLGISIFLQFERHIVPIYVLTYGSLLWSIFFGLCHFFGPKLFFPKPIDLMLATYAARPDHIGNAFRMNLLVFPTFPGCFLVYAAD
jgi:hypothetical protein